jgi:hypothetical protein
MLQTIQRNVTWRAIPLAGLVAGTVFIVTLLLEASPALFLRYIASLVLGEAVLTDTSPGVLVVGALVHYALSLLFTLVITIVVHRWGLLVGIVGGGLLGLCIYAINLYTFTLLFPWFFAIDSPILILSHLLFGMTAGGIYELFDHYDVPLFAEDPANERKLP